MRIYKEMIKCTVEGSFRGKASPTERDIEILKDQKDSYLLVE